ncbi:TPT domain-containing protein [Mycena indigotica]|uniref:TPT domain-containing protein n=1 Tax=Mycena indigotica TaxID=2126181 RepID=A0A8H6WB15_9AGAR|nr:TPT domain-containing protein [Mycena indigotica]KAF7309736.1 TPT domain-containing protein [Mycena indigotica]
MTMTMSEPTADPPSRTLVVSVVLFYIVAALAMIVANKWVLNATSAALFLLLVQLLISAFLLWIADLFRLFQDRLTLDIATCKALIPLIALNVTGLSFSNYTLKFVDTSFYQVARGLVLPFTVAASFFLLQTRPSVRILSACALVTAGFFIGVLLDGTPLSLVGIGFGVVSSLITAVATVVIKKSLPLVNDSSILLAWYSNVLSAVVLVPVMFVAGEGPAIFALLRGAPAPGAPEGTPSELPTFLWGSLVTGVVGFAMSVAGPLSIKVTSPISHMISAAVRGVASSFLGLWLFHDLISSGRAASIAVVLGGSIFYTWIKNEETKAAKTTGGYERVPMNEIDLERGSQLEERD